MRRLLFICRHAETCDPYLLQPDFERELTPEGIRQAHETGRWLREHYQKVDAVVSSPARRAGATARILAGRLYFDEERIQYDPEIYNPKETQLLNSIAKLPTSVSSALVISHNPALTQLLRTLVNKSLPYLETGQVAAVALTLDSWEEIYIASGELLSSNLEYSH
ncbi:MAG TPA: histidine phosphatase family protein [Pontibacter sp.]